MRLFGYEINSVSNDTIRLPEQLHFYKNADFSTQLKARFIYYLIGVLLISLFIVLSYTAYIQSIDPLQLHKINFTILTVESSLLLFYLISFNLLKKGKIHLSGHLLIASTLIATWIIIFMLKSTTISRLDTIAISFAALSMLPIVVNKHKTTILIYFLINFLVFIGFIFYLSIENIINTATLVDYFSDNAISYLFLGVVTYNVFLINKLSLEKAEIDIKKRKLVEKELFNSEKRFREMTEFLPQIVFETDEKGNLTYVNKNGYAQFGYAENEFQTTINILSTILPEEHEKVKENIRLLFNGGYKIGNQYTAVRKDGSTFPVKIYTDVINDADNKIIGLRGLIIDITEQVLANNDLKSSRDQFKSLVNNIPGITYRCKYDTNWTMLYMSTEIDKLSGYPSSDFINNTIRTYSSVIHTSDTELIEQTVKKAVSEKSQWELEYRIIHKEGAIRWAYEKGMPVFDSEGQVKYLDGFILDITERKKAEKELAESEEKYRTLMENMDEVVILVDNRDCIKYVNKKFTEKLGYTPEEIIGKVGYEVLLNPEEHSLIIEANKKREQNQPGQYEITFKSKSGKKIDFLVNGAPLKDKEGTIWGSIGTLTDITIRKKAEKALRESEERYRKLIEAFPDIIMISDLEGNILYANKKLEELTGISPNDYTNKKRKAHIHPDDLDSVKNAMLEILNGTKKQSDVIENRFIDMWGNTRYFSGIISQIYWDEKLVLQTISRDITEKKLIEQELENYRSHLEQLVKERTEELQATNEELISANEELYSQREELQTTINELNQTQKQLIESEKMASLGILSAGITHEINNPLNFIQGGIFGIEEYLKDHFQSSIEPMEPMIDGIKTGVERVSKIVTSLNHFSRQNSSDTENCNIHEIIDNCLIILQNQMKFKIEVEKYFTQEPVNIIGNEGKLHQAFLNVISNAQQAIAEKGIIKIETQVLHHKIIVKIKDTGLGIKPEHLSQIFNPFFTTKDPGKGTGLGLSITFKIIQEHKGKIEFFSKPNEGTTVVITLPFCNF